MGKLLFFQHSNAHTETGVCILRLRNRIKKNKHLSRYAGMNAFPIQSVLFVCFYFVFKGKYLHVQYTHTSARRIRINIAQYTVRGNSLCQASPHKCESNMRKFYFIAKTSARLYFYFPHFNKLISNKTFVCSTAKLSIIGQKRIGVRSVCSRKRVNLKIMINKKKNGKQIDRHTIDVCLMYRMKGRPLDLLDECVFSSSSLKLEWDMCGWIIFFYLFRWRLNRCNGFTVKFDVLHTYIQFRRGRIKNAIGVKSIPPLLGVRLYLRQWNRRSNSICLW